MNNLMLTSTIAIGLFATGSLASVTTYTSETSLMGSVTNFADFNGLVNDQSLLGYEEDGLGVSVARSYFSWDAPGLDGSEMFYAGTGSLELVDITLVGGQSFSDLEMQVSSGWSPTEIGEMYLWVQVYADGDLIQEIDINATTGDYLGIAGGGFDRLLIGSYVNAETRDSHTANQRNAIAIDNLSVGFVIPAPGGLLSFSAAGLIGLRRRRA